MTKETQIDTTKKKQDEAAGDKKEKDEKLKDEMGRPLTESDI